MKRFSALVGWGYRSLAFSLSLVRSERAGRQTGDGQLDTQSSAVPCVQMQSYEYLLYVNLLVRLKFNNKFLSSRQYVTFPQNFHRQSLINF